MGHEPRVGPVLAEQHCMLRCTRDDEIFLLLYIAERMSIAVAFARAL